jgi:probable O-glycosylation ligase (exosortase A-associated)
VHDVHSIYFEQLGEHGFPGLAIFLSLGLMTWVRCNQIMRVCKRDPERKWAADLAAMVQVSLVGYATAGAFLGLSYFDLFYHLIAMTVIAWTIVSQQQAAVPIKEIKAAGRSFTRQRAARAGP